MVKLLSNSEQHKITNPRNCPFLPLRRAIITQTEHLKIFLLITYRWQPIYPFDPNNQFSEESIAFWVKWADFYMWPHIIQYDSFEELSSLIQNTDLDKVSANIQQENEIMKKELFQTWNNIFDRLFNGVEKEELGKDQSKKGWTWEEAMKHNYKIEVGECGSGAPGRSNDNFQNVDYKKVVV